ncbi:Averantin hydroxylase [Lecanosticta acicola]|uniref:Averantin hydroxylase n=1 Tax=Lecanosticta acicola TaxID=111012 RepID=A0AAI9EA37_9PEZI|nr:Averantin hydroxylase [Lecanosticta acicola]
MAALLIDSLRRFGELALWGSLSVFVGGVVFAIFKVLYNISPFHPLAKHPGPLLWRASRLPASYHHATGNLYQRIAAMHEKYGETVRIAPDELSFTNPEAWPQIYNARPQLQKTDYHFSPNGDLRLPPSMITAPDAEHMRLRRLAGPAFLNSGVAEVEPVLQEYTDLLCKQLTVASTEGSQNMVEWFLWTLNDVIGQLALDQDFECLKLRRMHPWPQFMLRVLKQVATITQFRRFHIPLKPLMALMPRRALEERMNFFQTAFSAIAKRLAKENEEQAAPANGNTKKRDIVGLMLREMKNGDRLSDAEITANSILVVGGGAETTSTCLSAALYYLCKTPRVMQKLKDEIRSTFASSDEITLKATAELPYLKAVIDESLRIFPVASYITPRVAPEGGHIIDGKIIPGGTYVSMGQWFMGRSDRFFDNAKEFRPERWTDAQVQSVSGKRGDEILRPFSLGPRNCIGKLLALAEARLVTAKLIWHFDPELDGDHSTWVEDARFYYIITTRTTRSITLVTGANSGIGYEVVRQLIGNKSRHVLLGSRSAEKGEKAVKDLQSLNQPGTVELLEIDVSNYDSVIKAAEKVTKEHGKLDALVNNAGVATPPGDAPLHEQMEICFRTNAIGAQIVGDAFGPLLEKSTEDHARIVNVSSGAGSMTMRLDRSNPFYKRSFIQYRASKAAMNMVSTGMVADYEDKGFKVFTYCPGFTVSNLSGFNKLENGAKPTSEGAAPIVEMLNGKREGDHAKFAHADGHYAW